MEPKTNIRREQFKQIMNSDLYKTHKEFDFNHFKKLPEEIAMIIAKKLGNKSFRNFRLVSRDLKKIANFTVTIIRIEKNPLKFNYLKYFLKNAHYVSQQFPNTTLFEDNYFDWDIKQFRKVPKKQTNELKKDLEKMLELTMAQKSEYTKKYKILNEQEKEEIANKHNFLKANTLSNPRPAFLDNTDTFTQ